MWALIVGWFREIFGDHNRDLFKAAEVMRAFPDDIEFDPGMRGYAPTEKSGSTYRIIRMDAMTWLAFSGKFKYLGLDCVGQENAIIPINGRRSMIEAVRTSFGLTRKNMLRLFFSYEGDGNMTPSGYADRLEKFARKHV